MLTQSVAQSSAFQSATGFDPAATAARAPQGAQQAQAAPVGESGANANTRTPAVSAPAAGQDARNDPRNQSGEQRDAQGLTEEERRVVQELRKRDREVRQHERAHRVAGGAHTSPASYTYERGPDGKLYAVDGEVKIDTSEESSPEATIRKMETVIRAALAPADPSPQDRQVAADARQKKQEAQAELRRENGEENGQQSPLQEFRNQVEQAIAAYRKAGETGNGDGTGGAGQKLANLALEA